MQRARQARRTRLCAALVGALTAATLLSTATADAPTPRVPGDARPTALASAVRLPGALAGDVVAVFRVGDVDSALWSRVRSASQAAGARAVLARSAQAQVTRVRRGSATVQAAPAGWAVPFALTILPVDAIESIMGPLVSSGVGRRGTVAMSRSSADMRGAMEGDVLDIRTSGGGTLPFVVNRVVPDDMVGGTELVMADTSAAELGFSPAGRVVIYDIPSRERLDDELEARAIVDSEEFATIPSTSTRVRVRRSWRPTDPDSTLGLLQVKSALGEFAFVPRSNGDASISSSWIAEHVACDATRPVFYCRAVLDPSIPIRARCHDEILGDLRGALAEVARAGLAWTIDVANANAYGGCFYPRFNRLATNSFSGSLSRHSWAMALDTNTTTNAQGATPRMDCRVVRIFRKWGFSWGGNYLTPDGMHFEWVGEPRHTWRYPSKFCPNDDVARTAPPTSQRSTFFSGDGWLHDHHDH